MATNHSIGSDFRSASIASLLIGFVLLFVGAASAGEERPVLLSDTGEKRGGLPVLRPHSGGEEIEAALSRGLPGKLLRIYRLEQVYLQRKDGIKPQPMYVLLSDRQGGFARHGFFLDGEDKSETGYVDLYHGWPVTGRFGAMDQIFPHELAHVMFRQLAGPPEDGSANQVHALGVRTDRVVAFNEGYAEHLQVMAIEDADADPETRALAEDAERMETVERHLRAYRHELGSRLAVATRMRVGFLAWFSNDEDVLRYHAVKSNAFARRPPLPRGLLTGGDPYAAYLLENVLPGAPGDPVKSTSRMLATEGVISALFYRWATDETLRDTYREAAFYDQFGVRPDEVTPLENVYLKMIHVLWSYKSHDAHRFVSGYLETFPDEADAVRGVLDQVLFDPAPQAPPEIWLANPDFMTGTSLFDQFRGLPRIHTFDLNAASDVDLAGVSGLAPAVATRILDSTPLASLDDLGNVDGVDAALLDRFRSMALEMDRLRVEAEEESVEETLSLSIILMPYAWRAGTALVVAAVLAALFHRIGGSVGGVQGRRRAWWRCAINGLGAALVGLLAGWLAADAAGLGSLVAVGVLFGLPAAGWCLWRTGRPRVAARMLAIWIVAALPAAVLVTPLF